MSRPAKPNQQNCGICGAVLCKETTQSGVCKACQENPIKVLAFLVDQASAYQRKPKLAGYRQIKRLGGDNTGPWLVEEEKTGLLMVLRWREPQSADDAAAANLFRWEARMSAQLSHKHVVKQYKWGSVQDRHYVLTEYCAKASIHELLQRTGGPLSLEMATGLIFQVLDGLDYLHHAPLSVELGEGETRLDRGIVYRSLSPSTIFLANEEGRIAAKIAAISESMFRSRWETPGLPKGEINAYRFMPRQQILDVRCAKPDVDVWSAAACYYHMLTGAFPKEAKPGEDPIAVALTIDAVPIRNRNAAIPQRLAEVIDHALTDRPQIGRQSAVELKKRIEGAL